MADNIQSKGAYRVGISFNPSGNATVDQIKRMAADLIDFIEEIPTRHVDQTGGETFDKFSPEVARLKALAQTDIETAAMHAVKAATKRPPE